LALAARVAAALGQMLIQVQLILVAVAVAILIKALAETVAQE
jgi:hypothetical protein